MATLKKGNCDKARTGTKSPSRKVVPVNINTHRPEVIFGSAFYFQFFFFSYVGETDIRLWPLCLLFCRPGHASLMWEVIGFLAAGCYLEHACGRAWGGRK